MSILNDCPGEGYKLCRKKLHWYLPDPQRSLKRGCPECEKEASRRWRANNPEHSKQVKDKWRKNNKEKCAKFSLEWQRKNKDKVKKYREKRIEERRAYNRQWIKNNKDKARAACAKRNATRKKATVSWANKNAINMIYKKAEKLTQKTRFKFHVDHIYPLSSDWMCGLHVENNLQIITSTKNQSKSNRTWPGQLDCQKGSVYDIFPKELTDLLNDQEN